jgi:hypothetical protein
MSDSVRPKKRWDTGRYLRIVEATYRDGMLVVDFQDGARAEVAVADLDLDRSRGVEWERLRVEGPGVVAPTDGDDLELSSFGIRAMTDPEFAAHLEARAKESARSVGRKLAGIRVEQGLTVDEVADRSGLPSELIERIERGEAGNDLRPLDAILAALGYTFRDLVEVETDAETAAPVP